MIFSTQQVVKMLGLSYLPDEFTMAQYAQYRKKTAPAVSKELQSKVNNGEATKIRTTKNRWGVKVNVYRMN